jgi:hypothetical protein
VIPGGVVRVAEVGKGAGLIVAVPDRAAKIEGPVVALDGLPVVAEVVVGVAETIECFGLSCLVAEFGVQGQGLLAVGQCLVVVAEHGAEPADRIEGHRLPDLMAGRAAARVSSVEIAVSAAVIGTAGERASGGSAVRR